MTSMGEAAVRYTQRGWYVFPLAGKKPITARGHLDATTDEAIVESMWREHPNANIGVWLRRSGLIAVDVDVRGGKQGREQVAVLEARYGALPRTCHARSASGGEHVIMREPWGDATSREPVPVHIDGARHVDVKCNGYVLLAPSRTRHGSYEWVADQAPSAMPRAWAMAIDAARQDKRQADPDLWRASLGPLCARDDLALQERLLDLRRGEGASATFKAIAAVFHDFGLGLADGRPYIERWNRNCGDAHSPQELARQIERCSGKLERPRGWMRRMADFERAIRRFVDARRAQREEQAHDFAAAIQQALDDIARATGTRDDEVPAPLFDESATDLLRRDFAPTPWLVTNLVTEGGVAVIATNPKSGKTWAATEIAMAVATGTPAFGSFTTTRARRVAYFYAEDVAQSVRNRIRSLAGDRTSLSLLHPQPRGRYIDLCQPEDVALIVASCRRIGDIGLLVIDPMRDVHSGEENSSDQMRNVMRSLRVMSDLLRCTVLFVHHSTKQGDSLRGSSAIHGAIDCALHFSGLSGDSVTTFTNSVRSVVKGAQSAAPFDLSLYVQDDSNGEAVRATWTVSATNLGGPADIGREVEKVVSIVREHPRKA